MHDVYRGSVNSWECDENRHLNVRYFMEKVWEGAAHFAGAIGMPGAFGPRAESTLQPIDMHIRFLKELHAGAGLSVRAGVSSVGERAAMLFFEMLHNDGAPAATFAILTAHVEPHSGAPLPWPKDTLAALEAAACAVPAHGAPRSIDMSLAPDRDVSRARADDLGAPVTGRYAVGPQHCDAFGRMAPPWFIGRISDSMPNVRARRTANPARGAAGERRIGGAALEYRLTFRAWPKAGDLIETRSSVVEAAGKTRRMVHWLLDPITGAPWASAEVVAILLDMQTRKAVEMSEAERAAIMEAAIPAMWGR
jgi:acyl-CoA thioester hydrolase